MPIKESKERTFVFVDDLFPPPVALVSSCLPHTSYRKLQSYYEALMQFDSDDFCLCSHLGRQDKISIFRIREILSDLQKDYDAIEEFVEKNTQLEFPKLFREYVVQEDLGRNLLREFYWHVSDEQLNAIGQIIKVFLDCASKDDVILESNSDNEEFYLTVGGENPKVFKIESVRYSILYLMFVFNVIHAHWIGRTGSV